MRGCDERRGALFSYVDLEARVRPGHPLRPIREIVNAALASLGADFDALYAKDMGRPSIPPERLLRALLLQVFYGIRSERQIMERLEFDLLFRWFVGLGVDDPVWDATVFGKNRDRHALMENRSALIVDACVTTANGHAERIAALHMIEPRADRPGRISLGADKGYDAEDFVNELRSMNVTPHVAAKAKHSALDGRTTRHATYRLSQIIRKRIEEPFGWIKSAGGFAKTRLRGLAKVGWQFTFNAAAYNAIRLPKLLAGAG